MAKNHSERRRLLPLFLGLWLLPVPCMALGGPTGGFFVDTQSREQVRNFYNAVYKASEGVAAGWTGDISACDAGDTAPGYQDAVIRRVNYFRAMAGVPADVALDPALNAKAQEAALMMAANNALDHFPPPSWRCYSPAGYEAAGKSNLSLGSSGADAVAGQMRDDGGGNGAAGHRRWLLYPGTRFMGTGDVQVPGRAANALWIQDPAALGGTRPATRDGFVAWPPAGQVPRPLVYARWSFAYPGADFSRAEVRVLQDGIELPVRMESAANGYGENALVWVPALNPTVGDTAYRVEVRNVAVAGVAKTFEYDSIAIDPAAAGADTVLPRISGKAVLSLGETASFGIDPVPGATAYHWRWAGLGPAAVEGAENGAPGVIAETSPGYPYRVAKPRAKGRAAFHLAHPAAGVETLTFRSSFLVETDARIQYKDLLGWASPDQHAKVQVSTDDGVTWETVDERAGQFAGTTSGPPPTRFVRRVISLAGFAGRVIRLRFAFEFTSGRYFSETGTGFGWYLDDIRPIGLQILAGGGPAELPPSVPGFEFTPAAMSEFLLQARALGFGPYPLEWGPVFRAVAVPADAGSPRPFQFRPKTGVSPGALAYSDTVRPAGLRSPAAITIEGGEYSLNRGPYRTAPGLFRPGDGVRVRLAAAEAPNATAAARVNLGGVVAVFTVTTGN